MRNLILPRRQIGVGSLILVNASHPVRPEALRPARLAPALGAADILMESRAAALLQELVCSVNGSGRIVPVSGWRSAGEQQEIWDSTLASDGEAFTRQYVALPGCSEHQTGLAIDLGRAARQIDFIRPAFGDTGVCGAMKRAADRYGFILRYAADKQDITGIAHEPWHFRYVGTPHAFLMRRQNLCLEEYLAWLRRAERVCALPDGREVSIRYIPATGAATALSIPDDACCQISGDNEAGFILTLWAGQAAPRAPGADPHARQPGGAGWAV